MADSLVGNISENPMFVGAGDYHIQYASPCIDAGDPSLLDVDSSRSDMGAYGGQGGESYEYLDLAPAKPESLTAAFDSTVIALDWRDNTESDFAHYTIYRDTVSGFIPGLDNRIGTVDSSCYIDHNFEEGTAYFYRVSAWDSTHHESEYSDEVEVATTDVDVHPDGRPLPTTFRLYQNSPNPFNRTTVINYQLPMYNSQLTVTLRIFNVMGEEVITLVSGEQGAGSYEVKWDGQDKNGKEMASGLYFYQLRWGSERQVRRMLFIK